MDLLSGPLGIEASARLAGSHRWIEQRLFEILGRWSAAVAVPGAKALLGAQSHHHAWHAELWRGCLPTLAHLEPDAVTGPPSPAIAAFFDEVDDRAGAHDAVGKLVGVYRVAVPRLLAAYVARRARATSVADAPVIRALELIGADLRRDGEDGERLVQSLLRTGADACRAAERQGWLEARLIDGGGIP
jgi:hypothetical protein